MEGPGGIGAEVARTGVPRTDSDKPFSAEQVQEQTRAVYSDMIFAINAKNADLGGFFADIGRTPDGQRTLAIFANIPNSSTRYGVDSNLGPVAIHPMFATEVVDQHGDLQATEDAVKEKGLPYTVSTLEEADKKVSGSKQRWEGAARGAKLFAERKISEEYQSKLTEAQEALKVLQSV